MGRRIRIIAGKTTLKAELYNTPTADAFWQLLPTEGFANRWGNEIYFNSHLDQPLETDARDVLEIGEIAYWPPGKAICFFFGPTPASDPDGKPRAASEVNPVGMIVRNASTLKTVADGVDVRIERAE
ncbi:MAG: cyclophilin-like fold protein [Phycisphaerae bacterium]